MKKFKIYDPSQEAICEAVQKFERNENASKDFCYLVYNGHLKPEKTLNEYKHVCIDEHANVIGFD